MSEYVQIEDVRKRYPEEWVLLGHVKRGANQEVLGGSLLYHGPSKDDMYDAAIKARPIGFAFIHPLKRGSETVMMF